MPAQPRWLLALPDAIRQLDALDRALLTRRDLERLVGVSTGRAVALMTAVGAGRTGHLLTLPRAARLAGLPDGVSVEPGRIAVRFSGAQDAVGRLERFEALVEGGDLAGGGGAVRE